MTKIIQLAIDDRDFAWLEVLATGLLLDECNSHEESDRVLGCAHRKKQDDFAPAVKELLNDIIGHFVRGIKRSGCWEHEYVIGMTGWQGSYNPAVISKDIEKEAESYGYKTAQYLKVSKNENA